MDPIDASSVAGEGHGDGDTEATWPRLGRNYKSVLGQHPTMTTRREGLTIIK